VRERKRGSAENIATTAKVFQQDLYDLLIELL
jgi:hypothetical protein